jgi:hypothetical protein
MRADDYRVFADEAKQQAEKSISPDDRARWLEVADGWLKLADELDALGSGMRSCQ